MSASTLSSMSNEVCAKFHDLDKIFVLVHFSVSNIVFLEYEIFINVEVDCTCMRAMNKHMI